MVAFEEIPFDHAVDALEAVAEQVHFTASNPTAPRTARDRDELVALVLQDLAVNLRGGVSRLVRSDTGAVFIETASNGRPDRGMPAWEDVVEKEQLWKIFTFLETVQKK